LFAKRVWANPDVFGRMHPTEPLDVPTPLPVTERTWNELITVPPFTKASETSVGRLARSLRALAASPPDSTKGDDRPRWASIRA
jgi:hypothetical protein